MTASLVFLVFCPVSKQLLLKELASELPRVYLIVWEVPYIKGDTLMNRAATVAVLSARDPSVSHCASSRGGRVFSLVARLMSKVREKHLLTPAAGNFQDVTKRRRKWKDKAGESGALFCC